MVVIGRRTYGKLHLTPRNQWLMHRIEPHVAIKLKQLFPRIEKGRTDNFTFPNDQPTCADLAWFCSRYPMEMPAGELEMLEAGRAAFEDTMAEMDRILMPDYVPPAYAGLRDGQAIRLYQSQAIELWRRRRSLLLGDDLGLGKTYTAAGAMLLPEMRPAIAVVQTHLPRQWREKIESFTTLRVHEVKKGTPYSLPDSTDVIVFKYGQLAGWVDAFRVIQPQSVTFDEVQELRTGRASNKGAAAIALRECCTYGMGMSATPIYNYGGELWNVMQAIDPDVLGTFEEFAREWCTALGNGKWSVKDPIALGTYLREQNVFLRRTKKDVGQQVPPVNPLVEHVESDGKALADISDLARKLALRTTSGSFVERGQAARELDALLRHATGVGKARHVAAYVRILLEAKVPVLLAGWHRDVYEIWMRELADFKPVMYTGSESPKQKQTAVDAFLGGHTDLFIISLRSGAGLDGLQARCSTVVFGELDWAAGVHVQVIGRLDREGQTEQVTAIYLNSEDGSDPPMVSVLGLKAAQSQGIVDPSVEVVPIAADFSRVRELAKQFLDRRELKALDLAPVEIPAEPAAAQPSQLELIG
jgi:hypothetical protein